MRAGNVTNREVDGAAILGRVCMKRNRSSRTVIVVRSCDNEYKVWTKSPELGKAAPYVK